MLINLQNTRNEKTTQKTSSKIKPNRFLVCAPSNAAVDELMKKIIVAFKEKCQNRQEPLGMVYLKKICFYVRQTKPEGETGTID